MAKTPSKIKSSSCRALFDGSYLERDMGNRKVAVSGGELCVEAKKHNI